MKSRALFLLLATVAGPFVSSGAIDLKQSKFTQIVNDVKVITADQATKPAVVNDIFKVPEILRTGPASRAELIADDQTITRVGANTIFSFDPANRTIDLQKGSLLFHSPKGRGGGTIQTGSATASVLGTTIVVTTTPNGGFKILVLEGNAEIKFLNGLRQNLHAGEMTFVLPGGGTSPVIVFRLDEQTKHSLLVNGFDNALPSWDKISDEIEKQLKLLNKGKAEDTGLIVGDEATDSQIQAIDPSVREAYFNELEGGQFEPTFTGVGYLTIDGFLVVPSAESSATLPDARLAALALSLDITIDTAILNQAYVFINPGPFDISKPGQANITDFLVNPFLGVFGRNIHINTPTIDMSPYAGLEFFDFFAAQDLNINGSLSLDGVAPTDQIYFTAGNHLNIAAGSTLTAYVAYLYFGAISSLVFDNVTLNNHAGTMALTSLGSVGLTGGSIVTLGLAVSGHGGVNFDGTKIDGLDYSGECDILSDFLGDSVTPSILLNNVEIGSFGTVKISGVGDVNITGGSINSPDSSTSHGGISGDVTFISESGKLSLDGVSVTAGDDFSSGIARLGIAHPRIISLSGLAGINVANSSLSARTITMDSANGSLSLLNSSLSSGSQGIITLNAGDGITLDNNQFNGFVFSATAANTMNVGSASHGQDFSSVFVVNLSAHTLNLVNVAFGSGNFVNLFSSNGQLAANPNTGAASLPGYVNFINGITYGGTLITSANQSTYVNPESGTGIFIYSNH